MTEETPGRQGWCVYLVKCADGTLYAGVSNDLQRRIDEHNRGAASRYTRSRLPVTLAYRAGCRDKSSALREEWRIKSLSRKAKEALIAGAAGEPGSRPGAGVDSPDKARINRREKRATGSRRTV